LLGFRSLLTSLEGVVDDCRQIEPYLLFLYLTAFGELDYVKESKRKRAPLAFEPEWPSRSPTFPQ